MSSAVRCLRWSPPLDDDSSSWTTRMTPRGSSAAVSGWSTEPCACDTPIGCRSTLEGSGLKGLFNVVPSTPPLASHQARRCHLALPLFLPLPLLFPPWCCPWYCQPFCFPQVLDRWLPRQYSQLWLSPWGQGSLQ